MILSHQIMAQSPHRSADAPTSKENIKSVQSCRKSIAHQVVEKSNWTFPTLPFNFDADKNVSGALPEGWKPAKEGNECDERDDQYHNYDGL